MAHFVALHAVQALPLFALLVLRWRVARARAAVLAFTGLYRGLTVALFVQALAGLPLLPA